ncbi:hypothetical protein [Roseovarius salis]|uniref:hypothetical protein n=1 Tax=Roseovarius salis TaxID=3376063 RepID=UPI0037C593A1
MMMLDYLPGFLIMNRGDFVNDPRCALFGRGCIEPVPNTRALRDAMSPCAASIPGRSGT